MALEDGHDLTKDLAAVARRIGISPRTLDEARAVWDERRLAVLKGLAADNLASGRAREIWGRYHAIRRFVDEARRMVLTDEIDEDGPVLYAVDPHLINIYCSYWEGRHDKSLDVLNNEWGEGESAERTQFMVYLLGAVLKIRNLICLEAGRQEISGMLAFFLGLQESQASTPKHIQRFEAAIDEISTITGGAAHMSWNAQEVSAFIQTKFEALIAAGGIPQMSQGRSAQRLFNVLKYEKLRGAVAALKAELAHDAVESAKLDNAEVLYRSFLQNDALADAARQELHDAYSGYVRSSNLGDRSSTLTHENVAELRPGEIFNIQALFELRLRNACLAQAGSRARIKYVTVSNLIYAFLSAFKADDALIEVVHPRHVFLFENKPTPANKDRLSSVLINPHAFLEAVTADRDIRESELRHFETNYVDVIRIVRSTYSFAPVDGAPDRDALLRVMLTFIASIAPKHPAAAARLRAKIAPFTGYLGVTADNVQRAFGGAAAERSEEGFTAYRSLANTIEGPGKHRRVLIRSFGLKSENPDGSVPRLVCIPIRGGYRNIFKIYNTSVIAEMHERYRGGVRSITVSQLLSDVEKAVHRDRSRHPIDSGAADQFEAEALLNFIRAIYCVANREWTLSLSFTKVALELIDKAQEPSPHAPPMGNTPSGRRHLMAQEVLLLQHFARRAIASRESISRRQRWLKQAATDLHSSARATLSVDDHESFATRFEPNSVRQALTAIALLVEWMTLKGARLEAGLKAPDDLESTPVLPEANPNFAWHDLELSRRSLESYWQADDPGRLIVEDLEILLERVADNVAAVDAAEFAAGENDAAEREGAVTPEDAAVAERDANRHSGEFWRYIQMKAISLRLLVSLASELGMIPGPGVPKIGDRVFADYRTILEAHLSFVGQHNEDPADGAAPSDPDAEVNPFACFLIEAHTWLKSAADRPLSSDTDWARLKDFASLQQLYGALNETGFPRAIAKRFLATQGEVVLDPMRSIVSALERQARYAENESSAPGTAT